MLVWCGGVVSRKGDGTGVVNKKFFLENLDLILIAIDEIIDDG